MSDNPPPLPVRREPRLATEIGEDKTTGTVIGVVGPNEAGTGLREVAEGSDSASTHSIEDAGTTGEVSTMDDGGEDPKVTADGAFSTEEGIAGLELDPALGFLGVA